MQLDTCSYVKELQNTLFKPLCIEGNPQYLDLSLSKEIDDDQLVQFSKQCPTPDPLTDALSLVLTTMRWGPFEYTRLGINEILKSFLIHIQEDNQEDCTKCYMTCIYQIYLSGLLDEYPYTDLFWEYLSQCFDTVSKYLIEHKLDKGCQIFLNQVSKMGKWAAQKGLHTSSIQHFLHNMEIWARKDGFFELADSAKNHRFNLETF